MGKQVNDTMILDKSGEKVPYQLDSTFYLYGYNGDSIKGFRCKRLDLPAGGYNQFFFYEKILFKTSDLQVNELSSLDILEYSTTFECYKEPKGSAFFLTDSSECYTVGLSEQKKQLPAITIYPNPASGYTSITTNQNNPIAELSLYDATGKLVLKKEKVGPAIQLQLPEFRPGIYYLCLLFQNKSTATQKLMIH
jgi:hypothetical protein